MLKTLNTEGWQGLNDEYRFLYPEEVAKNPDLVEGLAARQDFQTEYFGFQSFHHFRVVVYPRRNFTELSCTDPLWRRLY